VTISDEDSIGLSRLQHFPAQRCKKDVENNPKPFPNLT